MIEQEHINISDRAAAAIREHLPQLLATNEPEVDTWCSITEMRDIDGQPSHLRVRVKVEIDYPVGGMLMAGGAAA